MSRCVPIAVVIVLSVSGLARGEPARAQPLTGYEAFLSGSREPIAGRTHRLRGVAYEVRGLAELAPLSRAAVRARLGYGPTRHSYTAWHRVTADDAGRFVLDLPVPDVVGPLYAEILVGQGERERLVELELEALSPIALQVVTDRVLYEPGERVHGWVRAWDRISGAPLPDLPVVAEWSAARAGTGETERATTSAAGVASFVATLPETAPEGPRAFTVTVGRGQTSTEGVARYRIGRRAVARLLAQLEVTPEAAGPGQAVTARITVRTPSGAPVPGARVTLSVAGEEVPMSIETDRLGAVTVSLDAPAYLPADSSYVSVTASVAHPAHGSADAQGGFTLARPRSLRVELIAPHGGLVPGLAGELYVVVRDAAGEPLPEGAAVVVRGAAVRGDEARTLLDRHGLAAVPVELPEGASAVHGGGACGGETATSFDVTVEAPPLSRTARLCVPVLTAALVVPTVARPIVAPGEAIDVRIDRRAEAARRPVVVELLAGASARRLVDVAVLGPGDATATLTAPRDVLGLLTVRARPLAGADDGSVEAAGALDALLAVPPHPSFVELERDREVYPVRGRARVTLRTAPAAGAGWVAVLARDLAAHGGEQGFGARFLEGAFDRAVLDRSTPDAARLVRAALAAHTAADPRPRRAPALVDDFGLRRGVSGWSFDLRRGDLRDPVALSDELRRRGVAAVMQTVEEGLEAAIAAGTLEEVVEGEGAARRFRADAFEHFGESQSFVTLGDELATIDLVTAADPSFTFATVAARVARQRLVRLLVALARYLDPDDAGRAARRGAAAEPPERWLSRLVQLGLLSPADLRDPWGNTFVLRRTGRAPVLALAVEAAGVELLSPGPDGAAGTVDDVRDPFARVVPPGTPYAVASGEDTLMRALARLSPGEDGLRALIAAYRRLQEELLEEATGDEAEAFESEAALGVDPENALGLLMGNQVGDGFGYGGLGLRGTGRGGGGSGFGQLGPTGRALGALLRERFPATLHFVPEQALDPSGRTAIELPLADATTSYVVEAIVWTRDGWAWSGATTLRVDQDVVVDAPVPTVATVGDHLRLPLRVAVRTSAAQRVRLRAEGSEALGLGPVETAPLEVPGGDAREVTAELALGARGEGHVTVTALGPDGAPLDATRRLLAVVDDARRVRDEAEAIVEGRGALTLTVPRSALERAGSAVSIALGPALFRAGDDVGDRSAEAWSAVFAGAAAAAQDVCLSRGDCSMPLALGAAWSNPGVDDAVLGEVLRAAPSGLRGYRGAATETEAERQALTLLLISPALLRADERPALRGDLLELAARLRASVEEDAALATDAPWLWAAQAAALLWSSPEGARNRRALELVRRARRSVVEVGDDAWLEGGARDRGEHLLDATALLALCELRLGDRDRAFRLVRTVARLAAAQSRRSPEARALDGLGRAVVQAAAAALTRGAGAPAVSVTLRLDGEARQVELTRGAAEIPLAALGRPGTHRVELDAPAGTVALVGLRAEYALPWSVGPAPADRGPLALAITGEPGALEGRAALRLEVRNTAPRLISAPVVEIDLPAGAELDDGARRRIAEQAARPPDLLGRTLTIALRPLRPGAEVVVELPVRWSVAGRLRGLGAVAYATDRPRAVTVLPSREVRIADLAE